MAHILHEALILGFTLFFHLGRQLCKFFDLKCKCKRFVFKNVMLFSQNIEKYLLRKKKIPGNVQ